MKPKRDRFLGLAPLADIGTKEPKEYDSNGFKVNPKPQKKRSTVTVSREKFLTFVCDALAQYQYLGPKQRTDLMVACRYALLSMENLCRMSRRKSETFSLLDSANVVGCRIINFEAASVIWEVLRWPLSPDLSPL